MTLLEERWILFWTEGVHMNFFIKGYAWYFLLLIVFEFLLINQKKSYVSANTAPNTPLIYDKAYDYRVKAFFAILVFLPLILIATNRGYYADTALYIGMYKGYPNNVSALSDYIDWNVKDPGFIIFSVIITML